MSTSYFRGAIIGALITLLLAIALSYTTTLGSILSPFITSNSSNSNSNSNSNSESTIITSDININTYTNTDTTDSTAIMRRAPVICFSHGGGPLPLLNDPAHKDITYSLANRVPKLLGLGTPQAPRAIVLVTAHWTTDTPYATSSAKPKLLYDYYGFPQETYSLKYDAPGSPSVAEEVRKVMEAEGLKPKLEDRPWDHGVFIPMTLVNPKADIPIVQVSVLQSEDPEEHFAMGRALGKLRDDNVAVLGSGFASLHNLSKMFELMRGGKTAAASFKARSDAWNKALGEAVGKKAPGERLAALAGWRKMPHADEMHPPRGGEHFMPLLVSAAAAGEEEVGSYKDEFVGIDVFTFFWGTSLKG